MPVGWPMLDELLCILTLILQKSVQSKLYWWLKSVWAPITKYHRLGINSSNLHLPVLEAGSSRLGCQYSWVRSLFWVTDFSLVPLIGEGARELCGTLLIKVLIPLLRALLSGSSHFPKASPPNTITLRVRRVSTYEFWEWHKHTDHSDSLRNSANLTTVLLTLFGNMLIFT